MKMSENSSRAVAKKRKKPAKRILNSRGAARTDKERSMRLRVTKSSGNVFIDLGFPLEEATVLAMRAELMARLRSVIDKRGWTQQEASKRLGIGQSRVSALVRGKWEKFSLELLITLVARVG